MMGGILKYGISNTFYSSKLFSSFFSFYFADIDDNGHLSLNDIKITFVGEMQSMICIRSGNVDIKYMKINNEKWIEPLIEVYGIKSTNIIIEILMSNISESNYTCKSEKSSACKSGIIYISKMSISNILLNISNCLFTKNIFNLFYNDNGYGNACHFSSIYETSSMTYNIIIFLTHNIIFFIIFFFLILYFNFYSIFNLELHFHRFYWICIWWWFMILYLFIYLFILFILFIYFIYLFICLFVCLFYILYIIIIIILYE
jgi:hypothetical protein